jgi:hypothetical protein
MEQPLQEPSTLAKQRIISRAETQARLQRFAVGGVLFAKETSPMNWKILSLTASLVAVLAAPAAMSQTRGRFQPATQTAGMDVAAPVSRAPAPSMPTMRRSGAEFSARSQMGGNSTVREHRTWAGNRDHRGGRGYWNHVHRDGTNHRHYYRRHPRFYTSLYSPFGYPYGYGYGYPYYGSSAALYYNGYHPQYGQSVGGGSVAVEVQRGLAQAGYYRGAVDGVIGAQTRSAIRAFERDNGLRVDGRIDDQLLETLGVG